MNRPTIDELRDIWRFTYARAAHLEALSYLDSLPGFSDSMPHTTVLRQALVTGLIVTYARPFVSSFVIPKGKSIVALGDALAPKDAALTEEHDRILKLRHKMIGHKDALPWEQGIDSPNRVVIDRDPTGFNVHTVVLQGVDEVVASRLRLLCAHYVAHCELRLKPLISKYKTELLNLPPGRHEIRITEAPEPWLVSAGA